MVTLDVTMDDAMLVQILQTLSNLSTHCCNLAFCQHVRRNNVRERATLDIFHHNPELVLEKDRFDKSGDIWMK